jgi:hypothetical protein
LKILKDLITIRFQSDNFNSVMKCQESMKC